MKEQDVNLSSYSDSIQTYTHCCSPGAEYATELVQYRVKFILKLLQQITGLSIQLSVEDRQLLHHYMPYTHQH